MGTKKKEKTKGPHDQSRGNTDYHQDHNLSALMFLKQLVGGDGRKSDGEHEMSIKTS